MFLEVFSWHFEFKLNYEVLLYVYIMKIYKLYVQHYIYFFNLYVLKFRSQVICKGIFQWLSNWRSFAQVCTSGWFCRIFRKQVSEIIPYFKRGQFLWHLDGFSPKLTLKNHLPQDSPKPAKHPLVWKLLLPHVYILHSPRSIMERKL